MDCVVEASIPPRRSSLLPARSPSFSGGGGGGSNASDCSNRGSCIGAADSNFDTAADAIKADRREGYTPFTADPCYSVPTSSATCHLVEEEGDEHQQQQQQRQPSNNAQFSKHLSFSTLGGSASNLTTLGNTTTITNTNTCTSVTGSSADSTPLSGASSHQQQLIREKAQRVVAEANQVRTSLDSRSNSSHSRHRDNEEHAAEEEEAEEQGATRQAATAAAVVVAVPHFASRSTPSSKRPRPSQQQQQQEQSSADDAARTMHIPDPTTFADSSTTSIAPVPVGANGSNTARAVHDTVDYEGEISRAVQKDQSQGEEQEEGEHKQQQQQLEAKSSTNAVTATSAFKIVPTMTAGSSSSLMQLVAPDATPQEPPPKRFATGSEGSMEDLGYVIMHRAVEEADNEEAETHPASALRHRRGLASTAENSSSNNNGNSNGDNEEDEMTSANSSNTRPSERKSSVVSRRATHASPSQQQQKESRRKSRLGSSSNGAGSRYSNDSITASIPYDPARFNTPPLAQQVQQRKSEDGPFTQSAGGNAGLRPELSSSGHHSRHRSENQPMSCATPPESQTHAKSTVTPPSQQPSQQEQESFQSPPAKPSIKLTETRYAFLALSFMMRMLCKLHKGEPIPSSDFHSHCIPPMSVTMYVQRLVRYCACSGEALLCAFLLLLKYAFHSGHPITIYNAHRLLITSVVLGIKLRDDVYYSNVYYGRIGGISGREMNKLEVLFLGRLDWETQVHEEEYAALLELLDALAIDVDPTAEQLAAFAAEFPEKVAAYLPDEDDDDVDEAAAKLQQGLTATSTTTTKAGATPSASAPAPEAQQRKALRGAYRLHQWHTLVEPWMAQLQQHIFARKERNAQAAAAAWQEEGQRWEQYYRDDEAEAARLQRENSASAWLSPLSVQKRATSASTVAPINTHVNGSNGCTGAAAWSAEPPYHPAWPHADATSYPFGHASSGYAASSQQQQQQQQEEEGNPRYSNFINFANVVTGGYFGVGASHRASGVPPANGAAGGAVRYHTATERGVRPSSATFDITNRATTATTTSASAGGFGADNTHHEDKSSSVGGMNANNNNNNGLSSVFSSSQQKQPQPSVAGTTARAASPTSSTTPGSGINVNAQPYYYVSSRMRKQQQQQQQQQQRPSSDVAAAQELSPSRADASPARPGASNSTNNSTGSALAVTDTTVAGARAAVAAAARVASPAETNDTGSSSSSFTSPACVNSAARFHSYPSNPPVSHASNGVEAVLAAMKRSSGAVLYNMDNEKVVSHVDPSDSNDTSKTIGNASSGASVTAAISHTFPARPIAKGLLGVGREGAEQTTAAHAPRRSPQTATTYQPPIHRRSAYTSQHSLGKKRSKPDSFKDY